MRAVKNTSSPTSIQRTSLVISDVRGLNPVMTLQLISALKLSSEITLQRLKKQRTEETKNT